MQQNNGEFTHDQEVIKRHLECGKSGAPDVVFHVGETVKVKGGDFTIEGIGKKFLRLRGLPGTRIAT